VIKIRELSDLNAPLRVLEDDERARKLARDRLLSGPYGRGGLHLRGARFVKFARKRGQPKQFGLHLLRNTGFANLGDRTYFLHATKGWRRTTTPGLAASLGTTLAHKLLLRNDLIHATKTGDEKGVEQARNALRRELDL